jgi:hypothetical protein
MPAARHDLEQAYRVLRLAHKLACVLPCPMVGHEKDRITTAQDCADHLNVPRCNLCRLIEQNRRYIAAWQSGSNKNPAQR